MDDPSPVAGGHGARVQRLGRAVTEEREVEFVPLMVLQTEDLSYTAKEVFAGRVDHAAFEPGVQLAGLEPQEQVHFLLPKVADAAAAADASLGKPVDPPEFGELRVITRISAEPCSAQNLSHPLDVHAASNLAY
ncbi:hypothetical protein GCM10020000_86620 [Streptomyces olivoverticillatus]